MRNDLEAAEPLSAPAARALAHEAAIRGPRPVGREVGRRRAGRENTSGRGACLGQLSEGIRVFEVCRNRGDDDAGIDRHELYSDQ